MKQPEAVIPKFDIGTWVYVVIKDFRVGKVGYFSMPTKIEWYKVYCTGKRPKKSVAYRAKIYGSGKSYMFYEKDIFATKEEAEAEVARRNK